MLVIEYCKNGDMHNYITRHEIMPEKEVLRIATQLLQAISYMHSRGIAHRDIKPENIGFDSRMSPKLLDFDLVKPADALFSTKCGTLFISAPEVIAGQQYDGKKADMWAFGVTIHLLATKLYPWPETNEGRFIQLIKNHALEVHICTPDQVKIVVERCLLIDPTKRANAEDILNCPELDSKDGFITLQTTRLVQTEMKIVKMSSNRLGMSRVGKLLIKPNLNSRKVTKFTSDASKRMPSIH